MIIIKDNLLQLGKTVYKNGAAVSILSKILLKTEFFLII